MKFAIKGAVPFRAFFIHLVVFTMGCSPPQKIYFREKETERNAPPRSGIVVDRFIFNKAAGNVDVLFVLDNTETANQARSTFQNSYNQFVALLGSPEARLLNYHVQVATTPSNGVTKNFLSNSNSAALHLSELFNGINGNPPRFNAQDSGFPQPWSATIAGLSSQAFLGRPPSPLFLVYLLGADSDPSTSVPPPDAIQALSDLRGLYQTHVFLLSRTTRTPDATAFPYCNTFQTADRVLAAIQAIQWRSVTQFDLCDSQWGTFSTALFQAIRAFKQKLVFSQVPYQPESMTLRGSARLYRFGDDYRYDAATNEVTFLNTGFIQDGDLLEVAYYIKPKDPTFQGSPDPAPLPDPRTNPSSGPTPSSTSGP